MSNPSLILPQSPAYGEDYVYAAQVEDGAVPLYNVLPLTFTRASGGTRINKDGLVQNMPYNLVQYSEDFTNGVWTTANLSISSNSTTSPNGTITADTLTEDTSTTRKILYTLPTIVANQQYTLSIYVKQNTLQYIRLIANDLNENFRWFGAQFNLTALTYTSATGSNGNATFTSASITDAGNGWYRISVSGTINTTSLLFGIFPSNGATLSSSDDRGGNTYLGTGKTAYIWGAQLNIGSTAQPYLATTDRLNMPRITYPVGGGCGALLLEKQSTNIVTYSEDATQQGLSNMSASANTAISPDGTQNADTITPSAGISDHYLITNATSVSSGVNFTASVFVKKKGYDYLYFGTGGDASFGAVRYQFSTNTFFGIAGPSIYSATNFGNGWVRLIIGGTTGGTDLRILITPSDSTGNRTFDSNGTDGLYVWGLQIEASSYATSYIPTTSTSATRIADLCYKTDIGSFFGTNKGTFFWQGVTPYFVSGAAQYLWDISDTINFNLNRFALYMVGTNLVQLYTSVTGGNNATLAQNSFAKIAIVWNGTSCSLYINGAVAINQTISNSNPTAFHLNSRYSLNENGNTQVGEVRIYNTNLSNAELIALTTL